MSSRDRAVAFKTLGCKVNRAESETIASELLGVGVAVVAEQDAEIIIVNTCTVTGEADAKARKAVRQALSGPREPIVIVTGCLAALDREALRGLDARVVVEADKSRVRSVVESLLGPRAVPATERRSADAAHRHNTGREARPAVAFRTRVALKIEDGCDAFCSYCIVPYARGVPRATPLDHLVAEARALVEAGTSEIVLTGINIGRYHDDGRGLADVIAAIASTGVARVRLSSVEPLDLTPELLNVMASTSSFCTHLHVPLQAGDDDVLAQMGRGYTTAEFAERITLARSMLPGLVVTTDVLAGFPGESAEQAANTLAFCEEQGFGKLHVFRYSRRPGTPAAERADQVSDACKSTRAAALRELSARQVAAHCSARVGDVTEVLVERSEIRDDGTAVAEGTTRDYLRVKFATSDPREGRLAQIRLVTAQADRVLGEECA